jgi:hypothetical protein
MCAHTCPVNEAATTWDTGATKAQQPSNLIPFKNVSVGKYKSCDDGAIPSLPYAYLFAIALLQERHLLTRKFFRAESLQVRATTSCGARFVAFLKLLS